MKILAIGDIFGRPGRDAVKKHLPDLKKEHAPDIVIANAENLSGGKGFIAEHIYDMREAGIDFFTSGNHVWHQKKSIQNLDDRNFPVIRPANYPVSVPGRGHAIFETKTMKKILVINLMGQVFMPDHLDSPFTAMDIILENTKDKHPDAIVVDLHAEATSEKWAMAHYLDSRTSFVYGTHTHVPTADARILKGGTAFISDIGMTGPYNSIIGLEKEPIIRRFITKLPAKHEVAKDEMRFNAVLATIDEKTGKATAIRLIQKP